MIYFFMQYEYIRAERYKSSLYSSICHRT